MKTHLLRIYERKWKYLKAKAKLKYKHFAFYATVSIRLKSDSKGDHELNARADFYRRKSDEARRTSLDYLHKAGLIAAKIKLIRGR